MNTRIAIPAFLAVATALGACGASDATGPRTPPHLTAANALALGDGFSCALTSNGEAYCWGLNDRGQLGNGLSTNAGGATAVATTERFSAISAGATGVCGLTADGSVWCWGTLPRGMPGDNGAWTTRPVKLATSTQFVSLSVGLRFACGLDAGGAAYCWGEGGRGQLGNGSTDSTATPTAVAGNITFTLVSAGFWSACGVTAGGTAYCWGDNLYGEIGTGAAATSYATPAPVAGALGFRSVDVGTLGACGVTTSGAGYCWGENRMGELGDGTSTSTTAPVRVQGDLAFDRIRPARGNSFELHACGVTTGGALYCWGVNDKGQVGSPSPASCTISIAPLPCTLAPAAVPMLGSVTAFDAGANHSCALTAAGTLMCWGDNASAELGDGTNVDHATPVAVVGGLHFP